MGIDRRELEFDRLFRTYGQALERLVAAYEPDRQEREDLLQDIALALWRSLPTFRHESSERTFVFRIAHNRALTHRHRRRRATAEPLDEGLSVGDEQTDPHAEYVRTQEQTELVRAVQALPQAYREVVLLRLEGLSNGEAAEVLGTSPNTIPFG